jgi:hypothetical protein
MTTGNLIGCRFADTSASRGLVMGFRWALLVLAVLALYGANARIFIGGMFWHWYEDDDRHSDYPVPPHALCSRSPHPYGCNELGVS